MISTPQLIQLVEKSSTFQERLNGRFQVDDSSPPSPHLVKQLKNWREVVGYNDQSLFEKRLDWDRLTLKDAQRVLGPLKWKDSSILPEWTQILQDSLATARGLSVYDLTQQSYPFLTEKVYPFEEVFVPFILVAKQAVKTVIPAYDSLLSPEAQCLIEQQLLQKLSHLCQQTLYMEFSIARSQKHTSLYTTLKGDKKTGRRVYQAFIQNLFEGKFASFFMEYAVLARLVATTIQFWVTSTGEMLERLLLDWSEISERFQLSSPLQQVTSIRPGLSDPHNNGRSVSILVFSSGFHLVYKPKSLGMDICFARFLAWASNHLSLDLRTLKVINRNEYGWLEYAESLPCRDEPAIQRYYQRIGMLLCLIYILEGTDCHGENVIASGEYPIFIDVETLFHPRVDPTSSNEAVDGAQNLAHQHYLNSVLRTALLPVWHLGQGGQSYDISGLGGVAGQELPHQQKVWHDINTDQMNQRQIKSLTKITPSTPFLNDKPTSPDDYLENIICGFSEAYTMLLNHQTKLLSSYGPLTPFYSQKGRYVFRHTMHYFLLLEKLLNPKYLRDGMERSIQLDVLSKASIRSKEKPSFWQLVKPETEAMEKLDIPYFTYSTDGTGIEANSQEIIPDFFNSPSYYIVRDRISHTLSQEDQERQVGLIRATFKLRFQETESHQTKLPEILMNTLTPMPLASIDQVALDIASHIAKQAIVASNGSASWLGFEHVLEAQQSVIQPLGYNLHSGTCGIALFLAALESVIPGSGYRQLALGALHQLRTSLNSDPQATSLLSQRMSLGGAIGLGSIVYSLVRIQHFLNEPALLEDAVLVADCITNGRIAADTKLDVMDGVAGALLGLLALYQYTPSENILEKAMMCGHHLITNQVINEKGKRAWPTIGGKLLTGFSHGAAGISYALSRLYQVTKNEQFKEAAIEGIAYENALFSTENQNWPDLLRSKDTPVWGNTWCHGAPGIGLARLGNLKIWDEGLLRDDVTVALQTTQRMFVEGLDTVCCGNLGRSELYIVAAQVLNNPALQEAAIQQATWVLTRKSSRGIFQMPYGVDSKSNDFQLGFFHGLAGIGYQLLRTTHPSLPSVILWE